MCPSTVKTHRPCLASCPARRGIVLPPLPRCRILTAAHMLPHSVRWRAHARALCHALCRTHTSALQLIPDAGREMERARAIAQTGRREKRARGRAKSVRACTWLQGERKSTAQGARRDGTPAGAKAPTPAAAPTMARAAYLALCRPARGVTGSATSGCEQGRGGCGRKRAAEAGIRASGARSCRGGAPYLSIFFVCGCKTACKGRAHGRHCTNWP
jgi:hypothetical protein